MRLFILAIVVRVVALWLHPGAPIEMEGAEYARIAESLRAGHGLVGIRGYPVPAFSPLYPFLIAACSFIFPSFEAAGVSLSVFAGAALVFPVRGIASLLYGSRTGLVAGILAAVVPFEVLLATQVFSEPLFVTLGMTGVYFTLRALLGEKRGDAPQGRMPAIFAGAAFAGAYLTRPEGLLFAGTAIGLFLFLQPRLASQAFALFASFVLCSLPYAALQYHQVGRFSLEGKSAVNYAIGERLASGMPYWRAANEVRDDLVEVGAEILPPSIVLPMPSLGDRLRFAVGATRAHFGTMLRILTGRACGGLLLFGFALWGLARSPWTRGGAKGQVALLSFFAANVAALSVVWHFWPRFDAFLVPFLLVWGAHGIEEVAQRFAGTRSLSGIAAAVAVIGFVFASSYVTQAHEKVSSVERDAGRWIAEHDSGARGKVTMETRDLVSYYSGSFWRPLPYASEQTALRYILHVGPRYVVLYEMDRQTRPYLAGWLARGIPSRAFVRVLDLHPGQPDELMLYRRVQAG